MTNQKHKFTYTDSERLEGTYRGLKVTMTHSFECTGRGITPIKSYNCEELKLRFVNGMNQFKRKADQRIQNIEELGREEWLKTLL
jgi:hypothetical protein